MSDGSNLWRALVSRKQWTKVSAASLEDARGEEESANPSAKDLHDVLEGLLLYHFMALAKTARDAAIAKEKEEDLKLGRAKLRGYLVRGDNDQSSFELLVGQHSFLVVRAKERRKSPRGMLEVTTTMKRLEVNAAMDDSLFCSSHSEAGAKWKR